QIWGLALLFCVLPASGSFQISIAYKVLEVYPQSRRVLLTCHAPQASPPVTYSLFASQGILVSKKVVWTQQPASFSINVTHKSSPDLLSYFCQAVSTSGLQWLSTQLQMYWELWAKPVTQLQANVTLHDGGSSPQAEMSCWAPSGSPPITYRLVSKDGQVHMQKTPPHGQPANFSIPPSPMPGWFQCQAENSISVQSMSGRPLSRTGEARPPLLPTGELPQGAALVLAGSLISIAAMTSGMLGWTR
uniref:IL-40-like Ig domain-containing protein n=1 Tax=Cavia porcellus TaxID=10141 RepID=H0UU10_CAVPO